MFDLFDTRFLDVLCRVAEGRLGAGHACAIALRDAVRDDNPDLRAAAQSALNALQPDDLVAMMADAHKMLREDPAGILENWTGDAPEGTRH